MYSAIVPLAKVLRKIIECPARATKNFAVPAETLKPANVRGELYNRYYRFK
jgi:hypothetical protein